MRIVFETIIATIIVPGVAIYGIPSFILRWTGKGWPSSFTWFHAFPLSIAIIGMGMVVWVSYSFVSKGRGTPIPLNPPTEFVASGLFRYVRNPMYVGVLLTLLSEVLFFQSAWLLAYSAMLWLILHTFLLLIEEPQLKARFGESYHEYLESTPRWAPRMPHRKETLPV